MDGGLNPVGRCWVPVERRLRPVSRPGRLGAEGLVDWGLRARIAMGRIGRGLAIAGVVDGRDGAEAAPGSERREGAALVVRIV